MLSIPTTQAIAADGSPSSFDVPPLHDDQLTLPELFEFHRVHNPSHSFFSWDTGDGDSGTLTWDQVNQGIDNVASQTIKLSGRKSSVTDAFQSDQPSYFALLFGIIRSGHTAFPISPRNSEAGVAHLVAKSGATHVYVSGDRAMQRLASSAQELLKDRTPGVKFSNIPTFQDIYSTTPKGTGGSLPKLETFDSDTTALIIHSSGSTAFPKPISLSHRHYIQWGLVPFFGERDISGRLVSSHSLPFFHTLGLTAVAWALTTGAILCVIKPKSPPQVPTPENIFHSIFSTKSELAFCVPSFLEQWAEEDGKMKLLASLDAVIYGGAPLRKESGDALHARGVNLFSIYGATELGAITQFCLNKTPRAGWEYMRISPHANCEFVPEEGHNSRVHRIYFKESPLHLPAVFNADLKGTPAYDTNDLLIEHPMERGFWKVYGRADDQIIHSNGEKTNPSPIEAIIRQHPYVANAVMFGRGKFLAGVLIEPQDVAATINLDFVNKIWPQIEKANKFSPSHSRILKEMVILANADKPFLQTAKGTVRRQVTLELYEHEIERLYTEIEGSARDKQAQSDDLSDLAGCKALTRRIFIKALNLRDDELVEEEDVFQFGMDSLQAISVRNQVVDAVTQHAPQAVAAIRGESSRFNFVYANPTIASLAQYIHERCKNASSGGVPSSVRPAVAESHTASSDMRALVNKYTKCFPKHKPKGSTPHKENVLVTGTTGSLGSYVLESLVSDNSVGAVYVLNRAHAGQSDYQRQLEAFQKRGIDPGLLHFGKIRFLRGDLTQDKLGLSKDTYETLQAELTCIIHIGWRVNFNVVLSSMEPLIAGTRNLIDLALSSSCNKPPKFVFASSNSVLQNFGGSFADEIIMEDPTVTAHSGYAQSKWVAELVIAKAAEITPLSPTIARIGQLSGGRNGFWNPAEWLPSLVRSAEVLGCLPQLPGFVSWLPIHTAAVALTEIRACPELVLHLAHPSPIPWNQIIDLLSAALAVPQKPFAEWLAMLEAFPSSAKDVEVNPAIRLLDFYRSIGKHTFTDESEAVNVVRLDTTKAIKHAKSLHPSVLAQLSGEDVAAWMRFWRSAGLLKGSNSTQHASAVITAKL